MTARIDALWPEPLTDLSDEQILARYAFPAGRPWLRMNFVSSLDGAMTVNGRTAGLGGPADHRVFDLLRYPADVILVGAGTVRAEGYGAMVLDDAAAAWRVAHGLGPQPVFAIVSGRLDLDPGSPIFTDAPVRPVVYGAATAPEGRRAALAEVADVVQAGRHDEVDPRAVREDLASRGLLKVHGEGGPGVFGSFLGAGAVDELCLTLAPQLVAGPAGRIARSPEAVSAGMHLSGVLQSGPELLLRYVSEDHQGS